MNTAENTAPAAPTADVALERSDRTILRKLADAAQELTAERLRLEDTTDPHMIGAYAQRVANAAEKLETIRELAAATGTARRNMALAEAALEGNNDDLY